MKPAPNHQNAKLAKRLSVTINKKIESVQLLVLKNKNNFQKCFSPFFIIKTKPKILI